MSEIAMRNSDMPIQDELREELLQLLDEPVSSARQRENTEFDRRVGTGASPLLLFGAGHIGRRTLRILRESGQEPVAFMDNNPKLWGHKIDELEVLSPAEAARRFTSADAAVVVTIWYGEATDTMFDRVSPLHVLGFRQIALFGHLAWKYPAMFLPHYSLDLPSLVLPQADRILQAFDLFTGRRSRELFLSHIKWRLHLDYDALPAPVPETIYFNSRLVKPISQEFLVDGGAFTGDTIQSFLSTFGQDGFQRIVSFEPDPNNFAQLEKYIATLPADQRSKIAALAGAVADKPGVVTIESSGGPSSRVGHGTHEVHCHMIDELIDGSSAPTFIKLDIEGYEPLALSGAAQTLRRPDVVVTVSAYHVQNHLWEIPLSVDAESTGHFFALVPHMADGWDLVLYAIPYDRLAVPPEMAGSL
jgi:FkbM family methyltransferase